MGFYFVVHTILGFVGGCTYILSRSTVVDKPLWMSGALGGLYVLLGSALASIGVVGALIATFAEYGVVWSFATLGEFVLGVIVAKFTPVEIQSLAAIICPFVVVVICGALFGFWYI